MTIANPVSSPLYSGSLLWAPSPEADVPPSLAPNNAGLTSGTGSTSGASSWSQFGPPPVLRSGTTQVPAGATHALSSAVPCNSATTKVQLGENSLADVARRLNLDPDHLREINPQIADPDALALGQDVKLPQCVGAPVAAPAPPPPLPADEQWMLQNAGKDALRELQKQKAAMADIQRDLSQAHKKFLQTGQVPQTKYAFKEIEIRNGRTMSRSERYDAMLEKYRMPHATVGDMTDDNRDPAYLTRQEYKEEFTARHKAERDQCLDEYTRPGKINKCQREVDEKNGGPGYKEWRDARDRQTYQQIQHTGDRIDRMKHGNAFSLAGRVIGRAIGGEKGEEIGAAIGGIADARAQVTVARAQMNPKTSVNTNTPPAPPSPGSDAIGRGVNWNPLRAPSLERYMPNLGNVPVVGATRKGNTTVDFRQLQANNSGRVFASSDVVTHHHVDKLANDLLTGPLANGKKVVIITGRHGSTAGWDIGSKESKFLLEDFVIAPASKNVEILDATKLTPQQMNAVLQRGDNVILAWCHSENSRSVIEAMGLNVKKAPF